MKTLILASLFLFAATSQAKRESRQLDWRTAGCYSRYGISPTVFSPESERMHWQWVAGLDPVCRAIFDDLWRRHTGN